MANKFCFEALDKSLKDIMSINGEASQKIFGGKVVVFCDDFRQILHVIPRGSKSDIIHATINTSYIWDHFKVLKLTKNMHLQSEAMTCTADDIQIFSEWILKIGDGTVFEPNDGYVEITIPQEFIISNFPDPIKAIVESTYPDLIHNYQYSNYLQSRAILASTIEVVYDINQYIINLLLGEENEYFSSNSIDGSEATDFDAFEHLKPEFLNALKISRLSNHSIKLKIGTTIMLLHNLDQSEGLCNGTRLSAIRLVNHVIEGQSLDNVGLYYVFSHDQLYVALSRVKTKEGLKILIHDKDKQARHIITNVVFEEVFQNI
ncbi:uncharacterized protein LOC127123598 [Lathyrus oleraceus]|uniref:uncharacterized protein LOC127123598 n=1 Tax=Pisum sativum TaxID=3888 RepID=UPI0021CE1C71|nr:uncharacterized protein LOC127123598 [Pisum sativum]